MRAIWVGRLHTHTQLSHQMQANLDNGPSDPQKAEIQPKTDAPNKKNNKHFLILTCSRSTQAWSVPLLMVKQKTHPPCKRIACLTQLDYMMQCMLPQAGTWSSMVVLHDSAPQALQQNKTNIMVVCTSSMVTVKCQKDMLFPYKLLI